MEKTDFKKMRQFYAKTFEKLRKFENGQFFLCHGMADLNRWYSALGWPPHHQKRKQYRVTKYALVPSCFNNFIPVFKIIVILCYVLSKS
jgi:hypothetical protein